MLCADYESVVCLSIDYFSLFVVVTVYPLFNVLF